MGSMLASNKKLHNSTCGSISSVFGKHWREMIKRITESVVCVMLVLVLVSCSQPPAADQKENASRLMGLKSGRDATVEEVSPPEAIQQLRLAIDSHTPKVKILGPKPNATLESTTVTVRFDVDDFPLFKDPELALGPHLHVFLDDRPYQAVYDAKQALTFKDLSPGTHTIRAFASRPWHESVKTPEAYDQLTFNVFAPTQANQPDPVQSLLTYSRPEGVYGAEPIMVDYYLTPSSNGKIAPPGKVRVSLNGKSFTTEEWTPIYLKGFNPGFNWVKLELLNSNDKLSSNVYSEAVRLIEFKPNGQDTLSKLVRGELTAQKAERIVDPQVSQRLAAQKRELQPIPAPKVSPTPEAIPMDEVLPSLSPKVSPSPPAIAPTLPTPPLAKPSVSPEPKPRRTFVRPTPSPRPSASPAPSPPETVKVLEKVDTPSFNKPLEREPKAKPAADKPFWSKFNPKQFLGDKASPSKNEVQDLTVAEPKPLIPSPSPMPLPTKAVAPAIAKPAVTPVKELEVKPLVSPSPSPAPGVKKSAIEKTASDWQDFLQLQRTNIDKAPLLKTTEPPKLPSRYLKKAEQVPASESETGS
jgi:hypothetical protein